ncbi:Bug family tripartite tricarboxylate transporter substrate binding protein [Cupriavidus alkaliphilus]|uniref:Tripartite-type tricarboxylate transporter receptor subunit TctC n=1 Tax=Cupriavidus alkaliphilus TaxID=942866 RepID=A0A7W4VD03_9BURK|nr:tripartite tricarboxylate transporter substrate binding protein [Cupriavidus alkaliphilus]MBB3009365.1 tripartite-type tricarboxylate transporter receptor subunit TctC [Cupriavidus alkaliphilus]PVY69752.1 tripartite-type tricarboxylate transporter receptor subunit TctC [Cupriavidus alkaliphilus]
MQQLSRFRGHARLALILALTVATAGAPLTTAAQSDWPSKPITYVVPYPPGGTTDILARLIAQKLGQALHTTVVVENKPGATGAIGSAFVARAAPDGYTILGASTASHAINPALNPRPTYDAVKSFAPVALVGTIPSVLVVGANSPYRDVRGLLAAAKREPGRLSYGSGGTGTILQMSAELLKQQQGVRMTHVPYKGDVPAIQDVMAGHVDFMFAPTAPILPLVRAGKLRALAVATKARAASLPNVPTMAEAGVAGFEAEQWQGIFAPAGTPAAVVQKLNAEINRALKDPEVRAQLDGLGINPASGSPQALADFQKEDIAKWTRVGKAGGIELE